MTTQQWPDKEIPAPGADTATDELIPCPFCDSPAKLFSAGEHAAAAVNCTACDAYGPSVIGKLAATAAWNRRAAGAPVQPEQPEQPEHDNLRDNIGQAIANEMQAGMQPGDEYPDWHDSREIDRLADAVIRVLPSPAGAVVARPDLLAARAEGRAEAVSIIMAMDPEDALIDCAVGSGPCPSTGEYDTHWDETKLREKFSAGDKLFDMELRLDTAFYEYQDARMAIQYEAEQRRDADLAHAFGVATAGAQSPTQPTAHEATLRDWLTRIHDNELSIGDRLQGLSSRISLLLEGEPEGKYPPYVIREQSARSPDAITRDGDVLTCSTCGHSAKMADPCSAGSPDAERDAARDVLAERQRQKEVEGWTPEHDDEHSGGDMSEAAACYISGSMYWSSFDTKQRWPWSHGWWKPKDRRRNLVRAAALLVAEIERMDRAAIGATSGETK